jgi:hypothetical protein
MYILLCGMALCMRQRIFASAVPTSPQDLVQRLAREQQIFQQVFLNCYVQQKPIIDFAQGKFIEDFNPYLIHYYVIRNRSSDDEGVKELKNYCAHLAELRYEKIEKVPLPKDYYMPNFSEEYDHSKSEDEYNKKCKNYYHTACYAFDMKRAVMKQDINLLLDEADMAKEDESSKIFNLLVVMADLYRVIDKINPLLRLVYEDECNLAKAKGGSRHPSMPLTGMMSVMLKEVSPQEFSCLLQLVTIFNTRYTMEKKFEYAKKFEAIKEGGNIPYIVHCYELGCAFEALKNLLVKIESFLHNELKIKCIDNRITKNWGGQHKVFNDQLLGILAIPRADLYKKHRLSDVLWMYLDYYYFYWLNDLVHLVYLGEHIYLLGKTDNGVVSMRDALMQLIPHCQKFFAYFKPYKTFYERLYKELLEIKPDNKDRRVIQFFRVIKCKSEGQGTYSTYDRSDRISFCETCNVVPDAISFDTTLPALASITESAMTISKKAEKNEWLAGTSATLKQKKQPMAAVSKKKAKKSKKHEKMEKQPQSKGQELPEIVPQLTTPVSDEVVATMSSSCTKPGTLAVQESEQVMSKKQKNKIAKNIASASAVQAVSQDISIKKVADYHVRIKKWFTEWANAQNYESKFYHSFPLKVDKKILMYGVKNTWKDGSYRYSLPGSVQYVDGQPQYGIFSITVDDKQVCYHREFIKKNRETIFQELKKHGSWNLDVATAEPYADDGFELPREQFKKLKKTGIIQDDNPFYMRIEDVWNKAQVVLIKPNSSF